MNSEKHKDRAPYDVRKVNAGDLHDIAELHLSAFPGFFLSFLGKRFLEEFYRGFLLDEKGIGFVAQKKNGTILGVIVGPLSPRGFFMRLLKKRWWAFCLASVTALLKHPTCISRLFRAVFYRGEAPSGRPRALLSSIAVSPDAQSKGVGENLVKAWMAEIQKQGAQGCYLTTDALHNETANRFYNRMGWKLESSFVTPEGRRMHRYVYDF